MARDFDQQVAEIQIRIAALSRYTALGIFGKKTSPFTPQVTVYMFYSYMNYKNNRAIEQERLRLPSPEPLIVLGRLKSAMSLGGVCPAIGATPTHRHLIRVQWTNWIQMPYGSVR